MLVDCEVAQKSGISPENSYVAWNFNMLNSILNYIALVSSVLFVSSHRDLIKERDTEKNPRVWRTYIFQS